jgi:uncharacterized protein
VGLGRLGTLALTLVLQDDVLAVCRLSQQAEVPEWAMRDGFCSITRTSDELSIVCRDDGRVPPDLKCEKGWRLFRVAGTQAFTLTGVLSSVLQPLAEAGISIFAVSTFDTDYVMVKAEALSQAIQTLREAGHTVEVN